MYTHGLTSHYTGDVEETLDCSLVESSFSPAMDPGSPEPMLKAKGFGKKLASNRMRDNLSAKRNTHSTTDDEETAVIK